MAANALTPIPNLGERQSGETKIVTAAATIPPPTPSNPVTARRVSVSALVKPTINKPSVEKPVEAAELAGKRIVGWVIAQEADSPAPVLVLLVKGENDQTPTRYELHVAARGINRSPAQRTHLRPDPGFLAPNLLGPYKRDSLDESSAVEATDDLQLGVRIISAALVPRPGRAWENNGAVRLVEHLALRLVLEPPPEPSEASQSGLGHARSGSTGGPKTLFVRARTTERDRARNNNLGSHVPNDGSDEEADHVGDRTSIGEDVILVRV
ncbi:unnamed protein product [Rhizoctonia solani]|uniref:Uncharacterized protein n=1 Tax=Rhizoctonia solani TaxID=456999 RepID=A0A8H2XVZ8_9AGAM|nr:unnamed protein product [Rhizoctonia solani]